MLSHSHHISIQRPHTATRNDFTFKAVENLGLCHLLVFFPFFLLYLFPSSGLSLCLSFSIFFVPFQNLAILSEDQAVFAEREQEWRGGGGGVGSGDEGFWLRFEDWLEICGMKH